MVYGALGLVRRVSSSATSGDACGPLLISLLYSRLEMCIKTVQHGSNIRIRLVEAMLTTVTGFLLPTAMACDQLCCTKINHNGADIYCLLSKAVAFCYFPAGAFWPKERRKP